VGKKTEPEEDNNFKSAFSPHFQPGPVIHSSFHTDFLSSSDLPNPAASQNSRSSSHTGCDSKPSWHGEFSGRRCPLITPLRQEVTWSLSQKVGFSKANKRVL
jgi:hypothetical protein